jgi:hypothetical protein
MVLRFDEAREAIAGLSAAERTALANLLRKLGATLRD